MGISLFGIAFVWAGVAKYGLLLAYLNASGYLAILMCGLITYQVVARFDAHLRRRSSEQRGAGARLRLLRHVLAFSTFSALFYVLFFVQPDKLAIAHLKNIPIEALYPCSNRPLNPEIENIAREIFRLREIDSFDDRYCDSGE